MRSRFWFVLLVLFVALLVRLPWHASTAVAETAIADSKIPAPTAPREAPVASDALKQYVDKPDDSYHWTKRREGDLGKGTYVELTLTSQTWHDIVWKHQLFIYKPSNLKKDSTEAILYIDGGSWKDSLEKPPAPGQDKLPSAALLIASAAENAQVPVAVLLQVPEEPIFNGLREDGIISYTFTKFLETNDPDWPALLPMVKSAVRAMDTVQTYVHDQWQVDVKHFLVTGASKRGWTTWLTAAVDDRVNALAPMVIDMLNMGPQMALQLMSFGGFSERIHDYTDKGLPKFLLTPNGGALQAIVDPYSYRHQLKQPKIVMLGTNDPYWPLEALNVYWDGLEGEKYILYEPNGVHGLRNYPRMIGDLTALLESVISGKPLPKLSWKYEDQGDGVRLSITSDTKPEAVQVWTTQSDTRDFRQAHWDAQPVSAKTEGEQTYVFELPKPDHGYGAMFGDVQFAGEKIPFYLCTQIRVVQAKPEK